MPEVGNKGRILYLTGSTGTGKSTIGKLLARNLNAGFADTDTLIENNEGRTVMDIFAEDGEAVFRQIETNTIKELAERGPKDRVLVVATGGGLILAEENRRLMRRSGTVIWLKTPVSELVRRLQGDTARPLLQNQDLEQKLTAMLEERTQFYQDCDFSVETGTPEMTVRQILSGLECESGAASEKMIDCKA
ncbi:MAG: shikimate kinase [Eubacteriaceae bacterium]|jgi:shikimate kinase